ncbi:MAG TPA: PilZ domain-containing protein [Candidatus Omnitrophota bacterium]|nr:PilZ domain-containing protein [Candidatus Omnitrophota bacterium]
MGEKRRFLRFDVLMDAFCNLAGQRKGLKIHNLSKEGVGVLSSYPLGIGDKIDVEMNIPGDNVPVVLQGEVAWASAPAQDSCHYQGGIKFESVANDDRARLLEYVYNRWIIPSVKNEN